MPLDRWSAAAWGLLAATEAGAAAAVAVTIRATSGPIVNPMAAVSQRRRTISGVEKATVPNKGRVAAENEEATEAWSGVLFDRFVEFRELIVHGIALHGAAAMQPHPPAPGDRVLDLGCGFGDTPQQLANLAGPEGEAVGVDVSEPFIEASIREADEEGARNVDFLVGDAQVMELPGTF